MEKNSALAPDREPMEAPEKAEFGSPDFLPAERIKAGITDVFLGLIAFAAIVAFCCSR